MFRGHGIFVETVKISMALSRKEVRQMAQPDTCAAREATVGALSREVKGQLISLRGELDDVFDRHPTPMQGTGGGGVEQGAANILDEIIGDLTDAREIIQSLAAFLRESVLNKIQ